MRFSLSLTFLFATLFSGAVLAVDDNQVRGEVISYDDDDRILRIQIMEAGDDLDLPVGTIRGWQIPDDVRIEFDIEGMIYSDFIGFDRREMQDGDIVQLYFDNIDPERVRTLRTVQTENIVLLDRVRREGRPLSERLDDNNRMASNDRNRSQRTALPDSASQLPTMALLGLVLAVLAMVARIARKRVSV